MNVTTTILGANGKLGQVLRYFAGQAGIGWRTQARGSGYDIRWSGAFDDPAANDVFLKGSTIINMIGDTGRDAQTLHRVNVSFVDDLLKRATDAGVAHVVLASSGSVYGTRDDLHHEEHPLQPANPYAHSKAAMETLAKTHSDTNHGPKITILRIGNVAGADALTQVARNCVASNTPMSIHRLPDTTAPVRSYIAPRDLFRVVRDLSGIPDEPLRIFNVAHPQPVGLDDLVAAYKTHLFPTLTWQDAPAPEGTPQRVELATDRLRRCVNFMPHDDPANALAMGASEFLNGRSTS